MTESDRGQTERMSEEELRPAELDLGPTQTAQAPRDAAYYDEVRRAVGRGALSLLLGTSTKSLERSLAKLKAVDQGEFTPRPQDASSNEDIRKPDDVAHKLSSLSASVLSIADVANRAAEYRRSGARVVFTNGCFDLLHRGHIEYLREARALGDVLIVGLNSDASVTQLKGPSRPIMKIEDRIILLTALRSVDHVVVFDGITAEDLVSAIQPNIYVKGGDYNSEYPPPEVRVAMKYGGEFRVLPYVEGISTTILIDKITRLKERQGEGLDNDLGLQDLSN